MAKELERNAKREESLLNMTEEARNKMKNVRVVMVDFDDRGIFAISRMFRLNRRSSKRMWCVEISRSGSPRRRISR